jgi:glycosyltransferase involved in cell wall biosynthesis
MGSLYDFCDALFFPSSNEGFGIPLLEAGLARMPIFCSDIPPLRESGGDRANFFDFNAEPRITAKKMAKKLLEDPTWSHRRKVLSRFTWEYIVVNLLIPLLEAE